MGQKVNPIGFRLGIVKTWNSRWFEEGRYKQWLHEDLQLRNFLKQKLHSASISEWVSLLPGGGSFMSTRAGCTRQSAAGAVPTTSRGDGAPPAPRT